MKNNKARYFLARLQQRLDALGPTAVAVSGGVDSMTLAVIANRVNEYSRIYHAVSPAVPTVATARVQHYAQREGWQLHVINANEMEDENYRRNPVNRCYFCKTNLYATIHASITNVAAKGTSYPKIFKSLPIASGTNLDDLIDFRPGLHAAAEYNVIHPYVDVGIDKPTLRDIAKYLQLEDLHDLPAAPCLASRVTTGITIDDQLLPLVDAVETKIWERFGKALSLATVRCRIQQDRISIQLQSAIDFDNTRSVHTDINRLVRTIFTDAGYENYHHVSVDPYRKGSAFIRATNLS